MKRRHRNPRLVDRAPLGVTAEDVRDAYLEPWAIKLRLIRGMEGVVDSMRNIRDDALETAAKIRAAHHD